MSAASVLGAVLLGMALLAGIQLLSPAAHLPSGRGLLALARGDTEPPAHVLPGSMTQVIAQVHTPSYGYHLFALGKNGSIFHRYQTGPTNTTAINPYVPMSDWLCLTPAPTTKENPIWGTAPAVAMNADGRIELFVGSVAGTLDLWQMYQTDAKNPLAWSKPRAGWCDALGPPKDPACAACSAAPPSDKCHEKYWTTIYVWVTSQHVLWLDPADKRLTLTWRSFTGEMWQLKQKEPNNSMQWNADSIILLNGTFM